MSHSIIKYVSIDRIFTKLNRDFMSGIPEGDVIEWTGEALEAIGAVPLHEQAVAFLEVKNHQCALPNGAHHIVQIARDTLFNEGDKLCASDVAETTNEETGEPLACPPVFLDCQGRPLNDYDIAYYRPYFDLRAEHAGFGQSALFRQRFVPVRKATNTFISAIQCKSTNENLQQLFDASGCEDEYTVVQGEILRFSFKEGFIALAYLRQPIDEDTGYPLIPDHYSYTTAITKYIMYKMSERLWYNGREGFQSKAQKAEQDWHWYCRQAINQALIPKGVDGYQNILDQRNYMLPRLKRYYGFFGKMARPEGRKFNDPDRRNFNGFFRGYSYLGN